MDTNLDYWKERAECNGCQLSTMFPIHQLEGLSPVLLPVEISEKQDVSELIVNYIPSSKSMAVMELGAGIG